ncbi:hydroxymethylglutaryl-CoA lyase [Sphingomonas sp. HITSZ_GF]|uniref:hydroxymethylglutaryl-CoA lyase n=1 Tax=Sphingomonas sp. HITSZ_GF TaxID=3037247 RepID=UPI00240D8D6D|nr:hydroxymethylglutaryl-CoA lyase [Sphingomonas sp. HITSZ_GF]MDG2533859.1 hydroxymethylglutaryl-CoA lyase [Sphingomonas sp. HITSZ_GF]
MNRIELVEVSPRDGLQNEPRTLATEDKLELIRRAIAAGARRLEVASFVHPEKVPQMADAEAVVACLPRGAARYVGLVLNKRGALRALETAVDEIGLVCAASDTFGMRNQGMDAQASLDMACDVLRFCQEQGRPAQATIAVAFGCPFEGAVDPARVVAMARRIAAAGSIEVAIADTIGIARPGEVEVLAVQVADAIAPLPLRVHFHDTRGMGVANVMAAVRAGAVTVDAAIGGTGGCPFAPGAAGNVASEDVAYALGDAMPVDIVQLVEAAGWLNAKLGRDRTSAIARALGAAR